MKLEFHSLECPSLVLKYFDFLSSTTLWEDRTLSPKPLVRASNSSKFFTDPKLLVEITQSFGVDVYRAAFLKRS